MRLKYILIGFIVLVIVITGILYISRKSKTNKLSVPLATPGIQQQIENKFKGLNIPEDSEKIELKDISGGESIGLATKNEILADLPKLSAGESYRAWLEKDGKQILLGTLRMAKGGWILNYDSAKFPGYNKVIITLGLKHILEGSF